MVVINFFCQVGLFASGSVRSHDSASAQIECRLLFSETSSSGDNEIVIKM